MNNPFIDFANQARYDVLLITLSACEAPQPLNDAAKQFVGQYSEEVNEYFASMDTCAGEDNIKRFSDVWIHWVILPGMDAQNASEQLVVGIDVTMYYGLKEQNAAFKVIMDQLPYCVTWKDINGYFMGCNKDFASFAGFGSSAEVVGKNDYDMRWSAKAEKFLEDDKLVYSKAKPKYCFEEINVLQDGTEVLLEVSKMPLVIEGTTKGIICIFRDVSDVRNSEKQVVKALEEKEAANNLKEEFLRNICHDLRTPLAGMMGETNLLIQKLQGHDAVNSLHDIHNAGKHMMNILNKFIESHAVTGPQVPINNEVFLLSDVVERIRTLYQPTLSLENIAFDVELPQQLLWLEMDCARLTAVVQNLVGNAIKFTGKGGMVKMSVSFATNSPDQGVLSIVISDNGVGIAEQDLGRIFEPFSKVSPSYRNIYQGSGLGLSVVKKYMHDLDGTLEVASRLGEGSTFSCVFGLTQRPHDTENASEIWTVSAPRDVHDVMASQKVGANHLQGKRVLCVEDDVFVMKVQTKTLTAAGCAEVLQAKTGVEAISLFKFNSNIDIVFLDLGLPDIEALDLIYALRSLEKNFGRKAIPIIALTAHLPIEEHMVYLQAGFNYIQIKPLLLDNVYSLFDKYTDKRC